MPTPMNAQGRDWADLKQEMIDRGGDDAKWRDGKTAVYVFNAGEDVAQVQKEAYTLYMSEEQARPPPSQPEADGRRSGRHGPVAAARP